MDIENKNLFGNFTHFCFEVKTPPEKKYFRNKKDLKSPREDQKPSRLSLSGY